QFKVPIDVWKCKQIDVNCPLQAVIYLDDWDFFSKHCLESEDKKKKIWNSLQNGKYKGFHHILGRYSCGICKNKNGQLSFNYHYPWELTFLSTHIDILSIRNDNEQMKKLMKQNLPLEAMSNALCSGCFYMITTFFPEIDLSLYEIIEYDFYRD
ncbi:MAG: hypothetical protein Q7I98_05120, partial [Erysipelotrichaceae bacterium]|nr:hypothetical protein [Erysipelotrichaceae bacterium]